MIALKVKSSRIALLFLVGALLSGCTKAVGNYFAPTAAIVNGEKIPEADLTRELRLLRDNPVLRNDPSNRALFEGRDAADLRKAKEYQILTGLIRRTVLVQSARRLGVTVSGSDVKAAVDSFNGSFKDAAARRKFLAEQHLTDAQVTDFLTRQLMSGKMQAKIGGEVVVEESQMRDYYNQNKTFYDEQFHLGHILVCSQVDPAGGCIPSDQDKSVASGIAERAKKGEDFAALARDNSKDPQSAPSGGDIGWWGRGQGLPFEQEVFALATGQVSDPLMGGGGEWHVLKVLAKGRPFEDAKSEISGALAGPLRQAKVEEFLSKEMSKANIKINSRFGRFDPETLNVVDRG